MKELMAQVRAFHEKCGVPVEREPVIPTTTRILLRRELIREESEEAADALDLVDFSRRPKNLAAVAKELADVIVVCVGTALELGIPLDRVWAEVHASNMTKSADHTRADGKILKGPDYRPPDIHKAIWGIDDPPSVGGEGDKP